MRITNFTHEVNNDMTLTVLPVTIFIGILSVIGIFGNIVVIYVYYSKYPTCNFRHFVIVLAGIDFISCVLLMPLEVVTLVKWFVFPYAWLCKGKSFLNAFTVTSSSATLLLIAIDRFRKVCCPHGKQIQQSCALKLTILVLFLSLIPSSSDAVFWGLHSDVIEFNGRNVSIRMCEKDDKFKDTELPKMHTLVLYGATNCFVMLSTMLLYIIIALKLFCIPTGPDRVLPRISVSSPVSTESDSGVASQKSIFKFPTGDIESGLSESEDMIDSVDLSDSKGEATDTECKHNNQHVATDAQKDDALTTKEKDAVSLHSFTPEEETVPLRRKHLSGDPISPKRTVRISAEIVRSSYGNELHAPEVEIRRKAQFNRHGGGTQGTHHAQHSKPLLHRRRSTVASLPGHTGTRLRRKTLIMFILTSAFVGTTLLYFVLLGHMSTSGNFMASLKHSERAAWMFFLRLYFINSILNPILYGFLDPRFRKALWNMGIRVTWLAGSVRRNIAESIRRSSSGRSKNAVT